MTEEWEVDYILGILSSRRRQDMFHVNGVVRDQEICGTDQHYEAIFSYKGKEYHIDYTVYRGSEFEIDQVQSNIILEDKEVMSALHKCLDALVPNFPERVR